MTNGTKAMSAAAARRSRWTKHLGDWARSGQTQQAFCAERSLALSSFRWWRARLRRSEGAKASVPFLPIALGADQSASAPVIEIELRSRTRLRLEGEAALRAVDRLVARIR